MTIADHNPSMDERPEPWPSQITIRPMIEGPSFVRTLAAPPAFIEALNELEYTTMKIEPGLCTVYHFHTDNTELHKWRRKRCLCAV